MRWIRPECRQKRAVAYYRHSAQDRQENSVEIQQDQVRAFARENDIEIIREFADRGKSGLSTEDRHEFNEMIRDYIEGATTEIDYVLVLDVSRWGRFQETDLSAYYTGLCSVHGVRVVFTTIGFPRDDGLLHGLHPVHLFALQEDSRRGRAVGATGGVCHGPLGSQVLPRHVSRLHCRELRQGIPLGSFTYPCRARCHGL
jgi:hypothetical protein